MFGSTPFEEYASEVRREGPVFHRFIFGNCIFFSLYHKMFTIRCPLARIPGVRRKRGRVVEGNSLENCRTRKGIRGSNPLASAKIENRKTLCLIKPSGSIMGE